MRSRSLGETLALWEKLLAGTEANREDLSALEPYRAQLAAELADVKDTLTRRLALQAESFQATRDLWSFLRKGSDLAERLQSGIVLQYGPRSPKLAEFGMKVSRLRLRLREEDRSGKEEAGVPPGNHRHR
jgi:hypothetical protein